MLTSAQPLISAAVGRAPPDSEEKLKEEGTSRVVASARERERCLGERVCKRDDAGFVRERKRRG
jgi:hypothetical protein